MKISLALVAVLCFASTLFAAEAQPCKGAECLTITTNGWIVGEVRTFAFGGESKDVIAQLARKGWVECAGQPANRHNFAALHKVLRSTWGSGDGSTDFYLPDLRGMFLRGWNHSSLQSHGPGLGGDADAAARLAPRPEISAPGTQGHPGDSVGSAQADQAQLQDHRHDTEGPRVRYQRAAGDGERFWGDSAGAKTGMVEAGTPRLTAETRPRNVYVLYMIFVGKDATSLIPR
jgi:hypothetical protein